jgi:energy-coupling factor transport system permease protein
MSSERLTYHPGYSILHKLHPLTKLAWLICGTIIVFLLKSPFAVGCAAITLFLCFPLNKINIKLIRGKRLLLGTAILLALAQILFIREGDVWVSLGPEAITQGGVYAGVYIAGRFISVITLSYLFVFTTEPNELAYSLMQAGLPYRYGFTLITALRLLPVFEQEGQIVYEAQLARGVRYNHKNPLRYVKLARQFVLPLLVSALSHVDALAVSMEGRCFGKYPTRTFLRQTRFSWRDSLFCFLLVAILAASILF